MKRCIRCDELKPLDKFHRDKRKQDGRRVYCKACVSDIDRERNAAKTPEQRRVDYERCRRRFQENPELFHRYNAKWRAANRTYDIARMRAYYAAHLHDFKRKHAAWRAANMHLVLAANARRRHAVKRAQGSHTENEWQAILQRQEHCCAMCGGRTVLTKDHIIPISRGGTNYASNLQALCGPCNSRKGRKMPADLAM